MAEYIELEKVQDIIADIYKDGNDVVEETCIKIWERIREMHALNLPLKRGKLTETYGKNDEYVKCLESAAYNIEQIPAANVRPVPPGGIGEMSDGYHTFNGLYYQRMILFAALVKAYKDKAWKSHRHEDGELCFGGGWFIVGIDTPNGSYTYHYDDTVWDFFDCEELPTAKNWDGHTEKDVTRLLSLVRPVVYCKDCRHRDPEDHKCDCGQLERAGCVFPVDDNYFCAYGEKMEES